MIIALLLLTASAWHEFSSDARRLHMTMVTRISSFATPCDYFHLRLTTWLDSGAVIHGAFLLWMLFWCNNLLDKISASQSRCNRFGVMACVSINHIIIIALIETVLKYFNINIVPRPRPAIEHFEHESINFHPKRRLLFAINRYEIMAWDFKIIDRCRGKEMRRRIDEIFWLISK